MSIEDKIKYGRVTTMKRADIMKCPHMIMVPEHYREDGTCRCNDIMHTKMVKWGYKWSAVTHTWRSNSK
jgi:hypothetical protein